MSNYILLKTMGRNYTFPNLEGTVLPEEVLDNRYWLVVYLFEINDWGWICTDTCVIEGTKCNEYDMSVISQP